MGLKPGMKVLDVGCGIGGPARAIARFADVHITGLNNNEFQIGRANMHAKNAGLQSQLTFAKGDFMKLSEQFGENSFDAGESDWDCLVVWVSCVFVEVLNECLSFFSLKFMPLRRLCTRQRGRASTVRF